MAVDPSALPHHRLSKSLRAQELTVWRQPFPVDGPVHGQSRVADAGLAVWFHRSQAIKLK